MTQVELARRIGKRRIYVAKVCGGKIKEPTVIGSIAKVLRVKVSQIECHLT
jgi:predicted transcriptional regulator